MTYANWLKLCYTKVYAIHSTRWCFLYQILNQNRSTSKKILLHTAACADDMNRYSSHHRRPKQVTNRTMPRQATQVYHKQQPLTRPTQIQCHTVYNTQIPSSRRTDTDNKQSTNTNNNNPELLAITIDQQLNFGIHIKKPKEKTAKNQTYNKISLKQIKLKHFLMIYN